MIEANAACPPFPSVQARICCMSSPSKACDCRTPSLDIVRSSTSRVSGQRGIVQQFWATTVLVVDHPIRVDLVPTVFSFLFFVFRTPKVSKMVSVMELSRIKSLVRAMKGWTYHRRGIQQTQGSDQIRSCRGSKGRQVPSHGIAHQVNLRTGMLG